MDTLPSAQRQLVGQRDRAHVESLLRKYPIITADERAEILAFLKNGPALDVGLLTANERLRPQLRRFRDEHAGALSLGVKEYLGAILVVAVYLGICALLWDAGVG